jgi:hypothetical protein
MNKKTSKQGGALLVLLIVLGLVWYHNSSSAGASEGEVKTAAGYRPMSVENPQIHWDRITGPQSTEYATTGRDIFNWQLPPPPPPPPPLHIPEAGDADFVPPPPPPPPPPKLPLKFFGVGTDAKGAARRAFLTDGNEVYIIAEGETVLGRYRVVKITNVNLEFEEISSNRTAFKALEDQGSGPGI